ncbi:Mediator of RNA polymerase II transcription subunit 18 [Xylographa opegraphella]|nr:Mediator of RNA polymerase II transcription subunit 18 [Xylographa opegraphella]
MVKPSVPVSQTQALQAQMHGDVFYLRLVGNMSSSSQIVSAGNSEGKVMASTLLENGSGGTTNEVTATTENIASPESVTDLNNHEWSIEFRDLPDVPGRRPVTSRLMASVPVTGGDPIHVMDSLGYNYVSEYLIQGYQLIHNNIILFLQLPYVVAPELQTESGNGLPPAPIPVEKLSSPGNFKPLDSGGTFVLQASVRVQDGTKPESMAIAISELTDFRDLMRGIVEMEVGDRLALDTRSR